MFCHSPPEQYPHLLTFLQGQAQSTTVLGQLITGNRNVEFYLGDWTGHFGIYPYRKPTNASTWPLYFDG
jgi:hypothetical protein